MVGGCEHLDFLSPQQEETEPLAPPQVPQAVNPGASANPFVLVTDVAPVNILSPDARVTIDTHGFAAEAETDEATRVAVLLPRSGRHAELGDAIWNAAQLALFDLGGGKLELMPYNTGGTPDRSARVAREAINDGARIILGPLLSSSTQAVAKVARSAYVPVVTFSNNSTVGGRGVFVLGFTPETEVRRVLNYAHAAGLSRFALIVPDNRYGDLISSTFRETADDLGSDVVRVERLTWRSPDYSGVVRSIAVDRAGVSSRPGGGFEALMLAELGSRIANLAARLPENGIEAETQILGTGTWEQPRTGGEPALIGGWFAVPDPALRADFERRYRENYNTSPHRLATLGYDGVALAATLVRTLPQAGFDRDILRAPAGFIGVDGLFRFGGTEIAERGLAVMRVGPGRLEVLDPAPSQFGPAAGI